MAEEQEKLSSITVGELSEAEILQAFLPILADHNHRVKTHTEDSKVIAGLSVGPGDDCSVIDFPSSRLVFTTDTQTESFDFRLHWASGYSTGGYEVGWKAATQNLADIASMGATPITLLISLSLPDSVQLQWIKDFARGLSESCFANGASYCTISGGDLGASSEISVTVTAVGQCQQQPILRSGARPGDVVAVAGELGTAAAGLAVLESPLVEKLAENEEDFVHIQRMVQDQQRPQTPVAAGELAADFAHSMMDISDGLIKDAKRMAQASGVSIHIESALLEKDCLALQPVSQWIHHRFQNSYDEIISADEIALNWVLSGGENHGLLACFPASVELPVGFRVIGRCESTESGYVFVDGKQPVISGWDHFKAE